KDAIINNCFAELYEIRKENYLEQQQSAFELQSKIDALLQRYEKLKLQLIEDTEESEAIQKEMNKINEDIAIYQDEMRMKWDLIGGDITVEKLVEVLETNKGKLTIATAEATELLDHLNGRYNNSSVDIILKAWEGTEYTSFRSTKEDVVIDNPLLNLCLFTQPSVMDSLRNHEKRGLPQRFLITYPAELKFENHQLFQESNKENEEIYRTNIRRLFEFKAREKIKIRVAEKAKTSLEILYNIILRESRDEDVNETVNEWKRKTFGNLLKVISLLIVAERIEELEDGRIIYLNVNDVTNIQKLYNYYLSHFKKAYKLIRDNVKEDDLYYFFKRILELFKTHAISGNLTSTILNNNISRFNSGERKQMLQVLEEHNLLNIKRKGRSLIISLHEKLENQSIHEILKTYIN